MKNLKKITKRDNCKVTRLLEKKNLYFIAAEEIRETSESEGGIEVFDETLV